MAGGFSIEDHAVFTEPVRLPSPPAESPLGGVLERVGAQMDQTGTQLYRARQAAAVFRAKTGIYTALKGAREQAAEAPDADTAKRLYADAAGKAKETASKLGFDDYTTAHIDLAFEHYNALTTLDVNRDAHEKVINQALAGAQQDINQNIIDAGNDSNIDKADWKEATRHSLDILRSKGLITPVQQGQMQLNTDKAMDHGSALALYRNNPELGEALLSNPKNFPSLTPIDREHLREGAASYSVNLMRLAATREARDEARAAKDLQMKQAATAADFYQHMAQHDDPDIEKHILARANDLGPVQMEKLLTSLKGGAFGDDKDTFSALKAEVYAPTVSGPQVRSDALSAYHDGKITAGTLSQIMSESVEYEARGGKPKVKAGVDIGREWLHTTTQVDNQSMFKTFDGQRQARIATAISDYETWVRANPNASPDVALKFAKQTASEWVRGVHLDAAGALPRPTGIPWLTDEKTGAPKFDEMSAANAKLKDSNLTQYNQNLKAIGAQSRAWKARQDKEASSGLKQ